MRIAFEASTSHMTAVVSSEAEMMYFSSADHEISEIPARDWGKSGAIDDVICACNTHFHTKDSSDLQCEPLGELQLVCFQNNPIF
jgi:hypothetical protein